MEKAIFFHLAKLRFIDDCEMDETPAGTASKSRPTARRLMDRPRKANEFRDHQNYPIDLCKPSMPVSSRIMKNRCKTPLNRQHELVIK